jgi:hypothetical protein
MATTAFPQMTTDSPARQALLFVKRPNEYPPRNSSAKATPFEIRSASRALLTKMNRTTRGNSEQKYHQKHSQCSKPVLFSKSRPYR